MASGVFVLTDNGRLVPMEAARFASEADFQVLLAKFPELLSGDQIDPAIPRKWILVRREKGVPSEDNGGGRWSLDHLFLDQDVAHAGSACRGPVTEGDPKAKPYGQARSTLG